MLHTDLIENGRRKLFFGVLLLIMFSSYYTISSNKTGFAQTNDLLGINIYYLTIYDNNSIGEQVDNQQVDLISAHVILRSQTNKSTDDSTIKNAIRHFQESGFFVLYPDTNLIIFGEPQLFEKVFKANLTLTKNNQTGGVSIHQDKELSVPETLRDVVKEVLVVPLPDFFQN